MSDVDRSWTLEGGPYAFMPGELIVGLPSLGMVLAMLDDLGVVHERPSVSEPLGMARVVLADVASAARQVLDKLDSDTRDGTPEHPRPQGALDQVLWGLRALFAAEYAGWMPTLGKNRLVGRVHGVGEVSHGGGGLPVPVGAPPALPARASGPGRDVRVGVLDTSLSPQPWLAGGWAARFSDTVADDAPSLYAEGHATFIAGLVLGQAPGATVEVRRALGDDGTADSWAVSQEIVRFGRSQLDVLNLSFLCYTEDGQPPMVLSAAVDRLGPDLVVVAAAGNHGALVDEDGNPRTDQQTRKPAWPAALDDVVAVGACAEDGSLAPFSPDAPWVDVHAPGVDLVSTYLPRARSAPEADPVEFGGFARWSGTSFSAALVSGAVAAGTDPGRVTGRAALLDILDALRESGAPPVARTHAPFLKLRTF